MGTFDATTAKNHFGRLLDACTKAPVAIEWHGRVVAYVLGAGQMPQVQALETSLDARLAHRLQRVAAKKPAFLKLLVADEDLARNLTLAIQAALDIAYHLCAARGRHARKDLLQLESKGAVARDLL